ncbi:MAG: hypothetical protein ACRDHF_04395 [Tepidiformaceae bacterium]
MRKLLTLAAAAALLLLTAAPVGGAFLTPADMQTEAARLGMPTETVFNTIEDADLNASFRVWCGFVALPAAEELCIPVVSFYGDWREAPYEIRLAVFLHEVGHYFQWAEGREFDEWNADVFAATEMCRRGLDGPYWTEQVMRYLTQTYGIGWDEGADTSHGSAAQRTDNVRARVLCWEQQA